MKLRDLKYLTAYIIPMLAMLGIQRGGMLSGAAVIFAFGLVPLLDPLFKDRSAPDPSNEVHRKKSVFFFDLLLYLNVPLVGIALYLFADALTHRALSTGEITWMTLSVGTMLGACGINVAHELGHRNSAFEQFLAILLLLPNHYMHFFIEHNRGHHRWVSTEHDPASARRGQNIYSFFIQTVVGSYLSAWKIQRTMLKADQKSFLSLSNAMLLFHLLSGLYLLMLALFFGLKTALVIALSGMVGFMLLETINYIEHYGLRRKKVDAERYERVMPHHSWNSNHILGRIILYELTRHSDHHYKASKHYQLLEHRPESPQLPFGYPTAMLLSLIPPLWFRIIHPRLRATEELASNDRVEKRGV
ncbi:MAG: hypothetical protein RL226_1174 [Bacteroidota bacterium]